MSLVLDASVALAWCFRDEGGEYAEGVLLILALPIAADPAARSRAFEAVRPLARRYGLSAYDAGYLELAVRLGLPLATLDEPLRVAADAEGVATA